MNASVHVSASSSAGNSSPDMEQLLNRHSWEVCHDPFPHVRARDVFKPAIYCELAGAFAAILNDRAEAGGWPGARFERNIAAYDASAVSLEGAVGWPLEIFVSRSWHDVFAKMFRVHACMCMGGALHHHEPGSADGFVHNDFNPAWFTDATRPDGVTVPDGHRCNYRYGPKPGYAGIRARETIRAVAIIYYLNNPEWQPGGGGETGLYRSERDRIDQAVVSVPPLNNSLVAFECTPKSFHAFRKNQRHERNSVIVWLHQTKETAIARFGADAIAQWPVQ